MDAYTTLVTPILIFLGTVLGVIAGRKMRGAEANKIDADAGSVEAATAATIQEIYRGMVDDLTIRVAMLSAEQTVMKTVHYQLVETLNANIAGLQTLISEQLVTITDLKKEIVELNKFIRELREQIVSMGHVPVKEKT